MPRLTLLKDNEINLFDFPPLLTDEERGRFFVLPDNEKEFRKIEAKIGYILQEGYFMSRRKFFLPEYYHPEDISYVKKLLGTPRNITLKGLTGFTNK